MGKWFEPVIVFSDVKNKGHGFVTGKKRDKQPEKAPKGAAAKKNREMKSPQKMHTERLKPTRFPIVGIGASAGGLEAFEAFFSAMPKDTGIAFILVSHLDPTHASILPDLIRKKTPMKVVQIADGMTVQPNIVYVIPPNRDLAILNGVLHLMEMPLPRGLNLPIDSFFRSLAQDQGSNAICIILSGTGTDGSLGLKEIKGETGMVMVQDEESAKYDGMPRSAVATGLADYVLPVTKMPEQLIKYTRHAIIAPKTILVTGEEKFQNALQKIFILLRAHTHHDFSLYKKNTICRRIERRMHVHQIDDISHYVKYLQKAEAEVHILFKDLLIGVTSFFRDPAAFEKLKELFLTRLLVGKPDDYTLRIWVAGCSSGEEAYSIAILLQECMETLNRHFDVQIFGTDIDGNAITTARSGVYPLSIAADVGPSRLKRFFIREESFFRIKKLIREMLVFAPQNLIKDPPFTKLDLLSCRNLLIYLGPELQKRLLPVFHYSLKQDGILFLGSSESIGQGADIFRMLDKKWKLFRRRLASRASRSMLEFPAPPVPETVPRQKDPEPAIAAGGIDNLQLVETILQQSDAPPCAVIDEKNDIVYIHGRTGRYLEPAAGRISVNIVDMARPGLRTPLAAAIRKVAVQKTQIVDPGVNVQADGDCVKLELIVKPFLEYGPMRGLIMAIFKEPARQMEKQAAGEPKKNSEVKQLEQELQYTRENLQTTIEELETSNEELKSTNEELQSTNEELQSTNEELETSKEELQSLNEESATVNAELQSRIDELSKANDDMKNLLDSTQIATVFLDADLCVRRFTAKSTELIPLAATDIGRPISHFATEIKGVKLAPYAEQVLDNLRMQEAEVEIIDSRFFRMRMMPYRTVRNVIDGVVITFEDITESKRIFTKLQESQQMLSMAQRWAKLGTWTLDIATNTVSCSEEVCRIAGIPMDEFDGRFETLVAMVHPEDKGIMSRQTQDKMIRDGKTQLEYRIVDQGTGRVKDVFLWAETTFGPDKKPASLAGTFQDITHRKQAERALIEGEEVRGAAAQNCPDNIMLLDSEGVIRYINRSVPHLEERQCAGSSVYDSVPERFRSAMAQCFARTLETGRRGRCEVEYITAGNRPLRYDYRVAPVGNGKRITGLAVSGREIGQEDTPGVAGGKAAAKK